MLLALFAVSSAASEFSIRHVLREDYRKLENEEADKDVQRCVSSLDREVEHLTTFCRSWSAWDDACSFVTHPTPEFIKANLVPQAFINNDLDVMWWLDNDGKCVWGKFYNNETGVEYTVPEFSSIAADPDNHLQHFTAPGQGTAGIVLTSAGPMLIVAQPIVTAENKGPIRGTLIQGRLVDEDVITALAKQTRVQFALWPDDGRPAPGVPASEMPAYRAKVHTAGWSKMTDETLSIFKYIPDLSGKRGMILRADIPRTISKYSSKSLLALTTATLVQDGLTALLVWMAVNALVVRPLTKMTRYVLNVGHLGNQRRTDIGRSDEIGVLAREFDRMVVRLDEQRGQLLSAKESAETASRAKSEFLARMSHEIRTPLNGVVGMIDLIGGTDMNAVQRHYMDLAHEAAESLMQVINDILDFSRIEAGKIELELVDFDLPKQIVDLVELFTPLALKKGLAIEQAVESSVPRHVIGDASRLRQVLTNLIGNALKFTDVGKINLSVKCEQAKWDCCCVTIEVKDTGVGIPKDRLDRLFQQFSQVDTSISRRYGGSGLGLAICKRLVELMGGDIAVESEEGAGTTFRFTVKFGMVADLSAVIPSPSITARIQTPLLAPLHILVAEDNEMNQFVTQETLRRAGHSCQIVTDGETAIQAYKLGKYDLILMDCHMPGMDGLEATAKIRQFEVDTDRRHMPIIALTADAMQGDREKYISAGMDGYISKPIDSSELLATIERLTRPRQAA